MAFIGLGNMGSAMARNLIGAGHTLTVYNRTRPRAEPLQKLGARIAATPSEAARSAGTLVTMLAADQAVKEVLFEPGRVLEALRPGSFRLPLGFKDNRLLLAAAEEQAVPMPLAGLIHDRFLAALAQGWSDADWSVIARVCFQEAGLKEGD